MKSGEPGSQWETPKKTVRAPSNRGNQMEVDVVDRNRFDPLWDDEEEAMQCGVCHPDERFHWP